MRKFLRRADGSCDLQAENADYQTLTANAETPIDIIGVVIEHRHRLVR